MKTYETTSEAYLGTLVDVMENYESVSEPRGLKCLEKFNYLFQVTKPTMDSIVTKDLERNKVIDGYSKKEFALYESRTNKAEDMAKASKFWLKIQNPDGTINSGYGYNIFERKSYGGQFELEQYEHPAFTTRAEKARKISEGCVEKEGKVFCMRPKMRSPYDYCVEALKRDSNTRQAIMQFANPEVFWFGNKDVTCTLHGAYSIRDSKLNLTINMRSNDLMLGLVYDLPWFVSLMYRMKEDLKETYPNLEIGTYTHLVHNIHIYERDLDKIKKMIGA